MNIITVAQLNRYVQSLLEQDEKLKDLYIKGEISNFKAHYSSGHFYFSLKNDNARVRAVMFKGYASRLKFNLEEGMAVIARATVGLYEVDGSYQLYVTDLMPDGEGAADLAIKQLKEKLEKKGYFDEENKKPLKKYPNIIGVVTSKTGAAFGDIKQVLSRRYPLAKILFSPATVQGENAPQSLISGINELDGKCDVIIIGRGGGSKEDLWAFNNEDLAETIFNANTPIVSAVGHEMDITICDLVADKRAPTPSAAAELVSPSVEEIAVYLASCKDIIERDALSRIKNLSQRLDNLTSSSVLRSPDLYIGEKQKKLDFLCNTMYNIQKKYFVDLKEKIKTKARILDSLSPFLVLSRGYSAVFKDDKPIRSVSQLKKDDNISLKLSDGELNAVVIDTIQKGRKK